MKYYLSYARKELKAQKITAVLIVIAIALSTIMTTAIGQSIGILQAMRVEQASSLNGERYATFHQLTKHQMRELSGDNRLFGAGSLINLGSTKLGNSGLTLFLREYLGDAIKNYPDIGNIKEGRLPKRANEIALPEEALQYLGSQFHVGDQITLDLQISKMIDTKPPYAYTAAFTICGILKSNYIGYATGTVDAVIGAGTAALLPERYLLYSTDFKTHSLDAFQSIVDDLAKQLDVPKEHIQYNWILLDALGISYAGTGSGKSASGFPFMVVAGILVGALVLLAAGLVIYNILKIAVMKRIREYGTLRAIGGERGQLYRLVGLELFILCGIGIPVGLVFGLLSAKGLLIAATGVLNPDLFIANSTAELNAAIGAASAENLLPLIVSAGITLLFAMAAAFPAARYAARVSPTVAMAGKSMKIKRWGGRKKKIRHFEAYYARLNLKRGWGRTVITILSLVMSITVFVALESFSGLLDTSRAAQGLHLGDYAVTNETLGIAPASVAELRKQEMVERLFTTKLSLYIRDGEGLMPIQTSLALQTWETLQVVSIDDARLTDTVPGLTKKDKADLLCGSACLVKNPIPFSLEGQAAAHTALKTGDTVSVNGKNLRVAGLINNPVTINNNGFTNGVQIIVCDTTYSELTGQYGYSEVYPVLREGADAAAFAGWLAQWCKANPGVHWLSYQQSDAQMEESFAQINLLCWGLILFIGLIGILNIINTIYSNIHTRVAEIGMQRAIGMSAQSLYKTFLWEGAYYGIIAAVVGGVLGYVCTIFVSAAATDKVQLVAIPIITIAQAAFLSILACLIATCVPLRKIAKLDIVKSIQSVE